MRFKPLPVLRVANFFWKTLLNHPDTWSSLAFSQLSDLQMHTATATRRFQRPDKPLRQNVLGVGYPHLPFPPCSSPHNSKNLDSVYPSSHRMAQDGFPAAPARVEHHLNSMLTEYFVSFFLKYILSRRASTFHWQYDFSILMINMRQQNGPAHWPRYATGPYHHTFPPYQGVGEHLQVRDGIAFGSSSSSPTLFNGVGRRSSRVRAACTTPTTFTRRSECFFIQLCESHGR
jgi:hypothetical protein